MNKYLGHYKKIVDELIKKSFSGLKNRKILVNEVYFFGLKYSAGVVYFVFFDLLAVNKKIRGYSKDAVIGLMAHELSHIEEIQEMDFIEKINFCFRWAFTSKRRADFETSADKRTIKKGYAKCRYKLAEQIEKTSTKEHLKSRKA